MIGAYFAAALIGWTGNYLLGVALALLATLVVGMLVEVVALRALYDRDHLDQVLATFGLILFFNELVSIIWGRGAQYASLPIWLQGHVDLFTGSRYPVYRLPFFSLGNGIDPFGTSSLHALGMLIRAGASNPRDGRSPGVNIQLLYTTYSASARRSPGRPGCSPGRSTRCSPAWAS
jgi:branched-chain amino acid transport system permease protein